MHHDRLKLCMDRSVPMWMHRLKHWVLDLDETLPYEEVDNKLGLTTLFEPPQPDIVQLLDSSQISPNQETSAPNLTQSSETFLADLLESNSEPLRPNQETVELPPQPASQPTRTNRIGKKPAHLKDYLI